MAIFMAMAHSPLSKQNMKEIGLREKCMEKVNIFGTMEGLIKENIKITKNMEKAHIITEMVKHIQDNGRMAFNMVKES